MFHKKISQLRFLYNKIYTEFTHQLFGYRCNQVTKQLSLTSEEQSGVSEMGSHYHMHRLLP